MEVPPSSETILSSLFGRSGDVDFLQNLWVPLNVHCASHDETQAHDASEAVESSILIEPGGILGNAAERYVKSVDSKPRVVYRTWIWYE